MDFGISIAMFLVITIVHIVFFCLITKYFQYRMNKKTEKQEEELSQADGMILKSDYDVEEGQYEQFLQKRKTIEQPKLNSKQNKEHVSLIETTQVEDPINASNDQIYGMSMLLQLPYDETLQQKLDSNNFAMSLIKPYRPNRFSKNRSNLTQGRSSGQSKNSVIPLLPLVKHQYISRLVCYNQQGIFITNVVVTSLIRQLDCVMQNKQINRTIITPMDVGLSDHLQVLGFESKIYSCMKYNIMVNIQNMIQNQEYRVNPQDTYESKEEIDFSEYYILKNKIERDQKEQASKISFCQFICTENESLTEN